MRTRLRDDPTLRDVSPDDVIADAVSAIDRAIAAAPAWFSTVPTATCSVTATRGGNLEPSIFHETVPGHHLQLASAQELDLHPVLGELEVTSFSEGWGLYAGRLADEMGRYTEPIQQLGML